MVVDRVLSLLLATLLVAGCSDGAVTTPDGATPSADAVTAATAVTVTFSGPTTVSPQSQHTWTASLSANADGDETVRWYVQPTYPDRSYYCGSGPNDVGSWMCSDEAPDDDLSLYVDAPDGDDFYIQAEVYDPDSDETDLSVTDFIQVESGSGGGGGGGDDGGSCEFDCVN